MHIDSTTYDEFIQNILDTRGRFDCGDKYHERHHIVPKCLGGTNKKENLIDLFAREHFVAHELLAKENPDNEKLVHTWAFMSRIRKDNEVFEITPAEYEDARTKFIQLMQGKKLSEEHRKKIGNATRGHIVPESARQAVAKANSSRIWTEESKQKLSEGMSGENHPSWGTHLTEETKKKISQSNKGKQTGNKNPRALPIVQFDKQDNLIAVWDYIKKASKALRIDTSDITACAKGKLKSAGGYHWKYLYDNKAKNGSVTLGALSLGLIMEDYALKMLEEERLTHMEHICPECGHVIECMCVIGADESVSGMTERLYLCRKCLSSWQIDTDQDGNESPTRRYFFG